MTVLTANLALNCHRKVFVNTECYLVLFADGSTVLSGWGMRLYSSLIGFHELGACKDSPRYAFTEKLSSRVHMQALAIVCKT